MNQLQEIGAYLRNARKEQKQTLESIKDQLGISHPTVSKIEKGHAVSLHILEKYSEFLGFKIRVQLIDDQR